MEAFSQLLLQRLTSAFQSLDCSAHEVDLPNMLKVCAACSLETPTIVCMKLLELMSFERPDRNIAMTLACQKLSCCEPRDRQPDGQRAKTCEVIRLDQRMTHNCLL